MSKLSQAAWRRNGVVGRLTWVRNNLRTLLNDKYLLRSERRNLLEAFDIIDEIIAENKKGWSRWKKINRKKLQQ